MNISTQARTRCAGWAIVMVLCVLSACAGTPQKSESAGHETPTQSPVFAVSARHPQQLTKTATESLEGRVIAKRKKVLAARATGVVLQVRVLAGDSVQKGQTLVLLSDPDQNLDLKELGRQHQTNTQVLVNLKRQVQDYRDMLKLGLVARHEVQTIENQWHNKQLEQENLEQQMAHLRLHQSQNTLVAPQTGYVQDIVAEGSYVNPGQTLVTLVAPQDQYLEVFVPLERRDAIHVGSVADWKQGQKVHQARVVRITPEAQSGLIRVLMQPDTVLPFDYKVNLNLHLNAISGWLLPKSALTLLDGEPVFYRIQKHGTQTEAQHEKAQIVQDLEQAVLVSNPLTPEEWVIDAQAALLQDGLAVQRQVQEPS